jgi:hypothetical protein
MGRMQSIVLVLLLVVLANAGCIASWDRAQRAFRDLGAAWVRALSGRRYSGNHSS